MTKDIHSRTRGRLPHSLLHHVLEFQAIDTVHIGDVAHARWLKHGLVDMDISVIRTSIRDINIDIGYQPISNVAPF